MKFDNTFISTLLQNLRANKLEFAGNSIKLATAASKSPYKVILESDYKVLDDAKMVDIILDSVQVKENPSFQKRLNDDNNFRENEIKFIIVAPSDPNWWSPEQIKNRLESLNHGYECESMFWADKKNVKSYESLIDFSFFIDTTLPMEKYETYKNYQEHIININEWLSYTQKLLEINFPEFHFSEKFSGKTLRFVKPLTDDCYLGIEYNNKWMTGLMKDGDIGLPQYFNLVLFNNSLKKNTSPKKYIYEYNDDILSLGILGNPFFYPPCAPLYGYRAVEMYRDENDPNNNTPMYSWELVKNGDGTFNIIHPQIFGEKMKKHAYFYMDVLRYTSIPYIEYIEKSIKDTL